MDRVQHLAIGAGVTGLAYANAVLARDLSASVLVLEKDGEPGGYCKTIHQDGFVWDYSGHFFHFKRPEIEEWLVARMADDEDIRVVEKQTFIHFKDHRIDFPFQKNIHQLPREDFVDCLHDLYFKDELDAADLDVTEGSFKEMVYRRFGRGIAERFLVPYNEKLYATDLNTLDKDAMGRFFPDADIGDVIRNMRRPDNASYNQTFTYPRGGAIQYIHALLKDLPEESVCLDEALLKIDLDRKIATTSEREIAYEHLVSSAPLPALLHMCGEPVDEEVWDWNQVLVFNLGFDRKGPDDVHWMYFPEAHLRFYRVGFYDNIMGDDRMSLYVEVGEPKHADFDVEAELARVMADLKKVGLVDEHELVSWHSVTLDPAYVHISRASNAARDEARDRLAERGVHTAGRYGGWTYCSIEDNIVEARALADRNVVTEETP
jgi:protoporphyrinogen oxidase